MDITKQFKASVMAVKVQRKGDISLDKNRILPSKAKSSGNAATDDFAKQAKEVCQKITTLRNLLLENRSAYMRIGQHLKNAAQMTDQQRDLIDRESEKFVTYYTQHLTKMRLDWYNKGKPQRKQHTEAVLDLLCNYLRNIQQIYQDQKNYRVQHELETYRLLKLAADKKKIPVRPAGEHSGKRIRATFSSGSSSEDLHEQADMNGFSDNDDNEIDNEEPMPSPKVRRRTHQKVTNTSNTSSEASGNATLSSSDSKSQIHSTQKVALDEDIKNAQQLDEEEAAAAKGLSPEDIQMFEQENVQLYHELQGLSEEVELIEKNVVDIAQLQDIFTEKVSLQHHNIERITNAVIGATENVKDANEQIKQAIQRNAGLRVWSLFFLLVMSFALLFLDWYYD